MANDLTKSEFEGKGVRTVVIKDEPWFVAKDVCEILEIQNHRDALTRIPEKHKGVASIDTLVNQGAFNGFKFELVDYTDATIL